MPQGQTPSTPDDGLTTRQSRNRPLVVVHHGAGKGKSTAGFGMIFRHIAHGMPCAVVQFIKGGRDTGERELLRTRFAQECRFFVSGEGFTWETQDRQRDIAKAHNIRLTNHSLYLYGHCANGDCKHDD